jgi:hypothetical protein
MAHEKNIVHERHEKVVGFVGRALPAMSGGARPTSDFSKAVFMFFVD